MLGAARSGWRRGFVFYVIDLVGFVGAVVAAIRLHEVFGTVYDAIGVSKRWAPVLGGLTIFVPLIIVVAIVGGRASKAVYRPGLWTTNRVLGAAFGGALALTMVAVGLMAAQTVRLPFGLGGLVERSPLGSQIVSWVAPAVGVVDDTLGLGLCDGRLASSVPEACDGSSTQTG